MSGQKPLSSKSGLLATGGALFPHTAVVLLLHICCALIHAGVPMLQHLLACHPPGAAAACNAALPAACVTRQQDAPQRDSMRVLFRSSSV